MLKNLVVVGGGFAGTRVTRALEHTTPQKQKHNACLRDAIPQAGFGHRERGRLRLIPRR